NGLLVVDMIELTLRLHKPSDKDLFSEKHFGDNNKRQENSFNPPMEFVSSSKYPKPKSMNAYPFSMTETVISLITLQNSSHYIEWKALINKFMTYGFWKGLLVLYMHLKQIQHCIYLAVLLDSKKPLLDLLCDERDPRLWKELLQCLIYVRGIGKPELHTKFYYILF
ncbi:hypothetical protein RFI_20662, partial [Reticulomyxa filosa]